MRGAERCPEFDIDCQLSPMNCWLIPSRRQMDKRKYARILWG